MKPALATSVNSDSAEVRPGTTTARLRTFVARVRPTSRVILLTAALAASAALLYAFGVNGLAWSSRSTHLPWIVLALAFAATDRFVVHVEVRDNAHSFTLNELPLVLGFFFWTPSEVVLARVVAALVVLGFQRVAPVKLAFNVVLAALGAEVAVTTFAALHSGATSSVAASTWIAAFAATAAVNVLDPLAIGAAIRLSGGVPPKGLAGRMLALGIVTCTATTSLGIVTALVAATDPVALLLVAVVAIVMYVAYRGYAVLHQRYDSLQQLYELTKALSHAPELDASIRVTLARTRDVLRAAEAELVLVEGLSPDGPAVRLVMASNGDLHTAAPEPVVEHPLWSMPVDGVPLVIRRGTRDADERALLKATGASDLVMVPLFQSGRFIGALAARERLGDVSTFNDEDAKVLATLGNHVSVSLENFHLIDRLRTELADKEHRALHDSLTGLGNRELFAADTTTALKRGDDNGWSVAVMLMDLDRFKEINDTLGHHQGDVLLRHVAARLRSALPGSASVARLGGDEFAVLLPRVRDRAEAFAVAVTVRDAFQTPFRAGTLSLAVSASIGIAVSPDDGTDPATLLQRADIAMYVAKDARGGAIEIYDPERDRTSARRLAIASDLKQAIDNEQLDVYYQPQAGARDGQILGLEALVRWTHPAHGPIGPDEFIPLAESVGCMPELTTFVMRTALEQLATWDGDGLHLAVAVNISARSLLDADFPTHVAGMLRDTGIDSERLTIEVTESEMMGEATRTLPVLHELAGS
ncbi:MAG: diguanylate cyclase, partial [Actinobacteria bacterium]|nr:diguanylate cyclase [Actinomycetota bacterium]